MWHHPLLFVDPTDRRKNLSVPTILFFQCSILEIVGFCQFFLCHLKVSHKKFGRFYRDSHGKRWRLCIPLRWTILSHSNLQPGDAEIFLLWMFFFPLLVWRSTTCLYWVLKLTLFARSFPCADRFGRLRDVVPCCTFGWMYRCWR